MVKCNNATLGLDDTTPVGAFRLVLRPMAASMAGNVWEWTVACGEGVSI